MSTETTNKKIKIDNGTTFGRTYTDKAVDAKLPTDLIASANKLSLGVGTTVLGSGVNLDGFTYDGATKTLKVSGGSGGGGGSSILRKDGTFVGEYEGVVANTIFLSPAEYGRVKNGEISIIYGECRLKANVVSNYKVVFDSTNNGDPYNYEYTDVIVEDNRILISDYQLTITKQDASLAIMTTTQPRVPTLPTDASIKNYALNSVNGALTWNTIGNGLEIKDGALQEKVLTISITDILTDNSKIQELLNKMTSTIEQSVLILFDNQISYDTYKDYDTIKLDLSPLSSMGISGYYILKNQSHVNGFTPVYSLNTIGMEYSGSNLNKLVVKNLFIIGNDEVNTPLNKFLLKIL